MSNKCCNSRLIKFAVIFYPVIFESLGPADLFCQLCHSKPCLKDLWLCAGKTSAVIDPPDTNALPIHITLKVLSVTCRDFSVMVSTEVLSLKPY